MAQTNGVMHVGLLADNWVGWDMYQNMLEMAYADKVCLARHHSSLYLVKDLVVTAFWSVEFGRFGSWSRVGQFRHAL